MSDEEFGMIIDDYRLDLQYPAHIFRNEEHCEKASWGVWALSELLDYAEKHSNLDKLTAVTNFSKLMKQYVSRHSGTTVIKSAEQYQKLYDTLKRSHRKQRMFFIAADVADDIADILRCSYNTTRRDDI